MRWTSVTTTLVAAAALTTPAVFARSPVVERFNLTLEGEIEVPVSGDPDGTGKAIIRINRFRQRLCYTLVVRGIEPATAAHIHEAPAGAPGPVVIPMQAPTGGTSHECLPLDRELLLDIVNNPANYYVNVHNAEYPGGALRAQLD